MKLAILADGRSPITRGWLSLLLDLDHEIHLLSTFPCEIDLPVASTHLVPIAFSNLAKPVEEAQRRPPGGAGVIGLRAAVRRWVGLITFPAGIRYLRRILKTLDVQLLHALRIPYEGMLAGAATPELPLILSVWGNDFTLHAHTAPWMGWLTRRALRRADGLHADCQRDISLAKSWGLSEKCPTVVLPGGGGIDRAVFYPGRPDLDRLRPEIRALLEAIPAEAPVVVNPRGFRAYVRNDTFFQSIPLVLHQMPGTVFLAPAMQGEQQAEQWLRRLGIEASVVLLPKLTPLEMAEIYRRSKVMVSPSEHDGTPNSFLEALACGCYPVVGDLESLREWIDESSNGSLVDQRNPESLADAVLRALGDDELRLQALENNQALIDERADRSRVGERLDSFYQAVIQA
jgi:glycosyltransferase involved in cell wall biosynthesis